MLIMIYQNGNSYHNFCKMLGEVQLVQFYIIWMIVKKQMKEHPEIEG